MKKFNYNGKEYKVYEKEYKYNGDNYKCLYIKSKDFEGVLIDYIEILDDLEFNIVMEREYLLTGEDLQEIKKCFI